MGNNDWWMNIGAGGADDFISYDFRTAIKESNFLEKITIVTLDLDFSVPNYVYNQKVTIKFDDGSDMTTYGGAYISNRVGGEAFKREVILDAQGNMTKENMITCSVCNFM